MSDKAKIAIATGDPAGIGPEISLRAALDPGGAQCLPPDRGQRSWRGRAARAGLRPQAQHPCDPERRGCGLVGRPPQRARLRAGGFGHPRLRHHRGRERTRLAGLCRCRDQRCPRGRSRRRCRGAAKRDLDRACRHQVRRLSIVRRARDRHRRGRRLPDAVFRRHQDRPRHASPERSRCDRDDHAARKSSA